MTKKILVNGCSFSLSCGFTNETIKYHWPKLLSNYYQCDLQTVALDGSPNEEIFLRTIDNTLRHDYDLIIIQWSQLSRTWFYPSTNNIDDYLGGIAETDSDEITQFQKYYFSYFNNQYVNLKKWLTKIITLQSYLKNKNQKFIFIKGFENYVNDFIQVDYKDGFINVAPIKNLLDFNSRPDDYLWRKISVIKNLINNIDQTNWVNFKSKSFFDMSIDTADDLNHPGPNSNKLLANKLIEHIAINNLLIS